MKIPKQFIDLHKKCYGNDNLARTTTCSCFNCLKVFNGSEIKRNKTELHGDLSSICPHCGMDTVLPMELDVDTLKQLNVHFLTPLK